MLGLLGAVWGVAGVLLILGFAIFRLSYVAFDAFSYPFQWYHWLVLIVFTIFMAHSEGYMGFQKQFSPRVVARAKFLLRNPSPMRVLFGPFFCIGYFHVTRKRRRVVILLNIAILIMIIIVRQLSQPWRGIIDVGVVVGLIWGVVAIMAFSWQAFLGNGFAHPTEVPADGQ